MSRASEPNATFAAILDDNRVSIGIAASMLETIGAWLDAIKWPPGWDVSESIIDEANQKLTDAAGLLRMARKRLPDPARAATSPRPPEGGSSPSGEGGGR